MSSLLVVMYRHWLPPQAFVLLALPSVLQKRWNLIGEDHLNTAWLLLITWQVIVPPCCINKLQSPENFLDLHLGQNILTVIAIIATYMAMANKSCMWIAFFSLS